MSSFVFSTVFFLVALFFIDFQIATEFHHDTIHVLTVRNGRLKCDSEKVDIESKDEQTDRINYTQLKKSRRPPKTATIRLKVIFNKGWVESSKGRCRRRCVKYARNQVRKLVNETEYIFSNKYSKENRLPTAFKIEIEKGLKQFMNSTLRYRI